MNVLNKLSCINIAIANGGSDMAAATGRRAAEQSSEIKSVAGGTCLALEQELTQA